MTHNIKIKHNYWVDIDNRNKTFEVRFNDRNYQKDDLIQFTVIKEDGTILMQPITTFIITYVLDYPEALKEGYVVLGIRPYN